MLAQSALHLLRVGAESDHLRFPEVKMFPECNCQVHCDSVDPAMSNERLKRMIDTEDCPTERRTLERILAARQI